MVSKIIPWLTGTICLSYIYHWTQGTMYPAWVPLIWCFACFVNDLYNAMEHKND